MLGEFLKRQMGSREPWNCSTSPAADWCVALGHRDFAAEWRGITDPAECEAVAADGLVALWDRGIGDALPVVTEFEAGDIGIVSRAGLEAGAVFTGDKWVLRSERGLTFLTLPADAILKAWRP